MQRLMTVFETGLFALVLGAMIIKPGELPGLGRRAGRLAGRAVKRLHEMKKEIHEYVEKNDMHSVQQELQETMAQLNRIRQDVRNVSSVQGMMMDFSASSVPENASIKNKTIDHEEQRRTGALQQTLQKKQDVTEDLMEGSTVVIPISAQDLDVAFSNSQTVIEHKSKTTNKVHYQDDATSASRLLMDALKEERVAEHALEFFNTPRKDTAKK